MSFIKFSTSFFILSNILHFSTLAYKMCGTKERPDSGSLAIFLATRRHVVICANQDECCAEGCCPQNPVHFDNFFFNHAWEIALTSMMIFVTLVLCICSCYYCKNNCQRKVILTPNRINVENRSSNNTSNQNDVTRGQITVSRAPPPPYDVAILLPPVHPNDRVPSYEEVMSSKRF